MKRDMQYGQENAVNKITELTGKNMAESGQATVDRCMQMEKYCGRIMLLGR